MKTFNTPHVVVDVEANGPIQGYHSMVSFGMVIVEPGFKRTFYGKVKPLTDFYVPEALAISGFSFEETQKFDDPQEVMQKAADWLKENIKGRPIFWSDNNGFDFAWMNWYFHTFLSENPFGHSSRRIADYICGLEDDLRFNWKRQRKTKHDHNPVNDAKGNAEVLLSYFPKNLGK
jgi:hypothetical protein